MKSTKKSLLISVLSLMVCVTLFVGTTYAWLTASVGSNSNIIQAGNLDVEFKYKNSTITEYTTFETTTNVFKTGTVWEPGHTEYAVLKISNKGKIAFKYSLGIYISSETTGTLVTTGDTNEEYKLSNYLKYAVLDGDKTTEENFGRSTLLSAAGDGKLLTEDSVTGGNLTAGAPDKVVTLVVWMPDDVTANYVTPTNEADNPKINLGISLTASQLTSESDSFDNQYDVVSTSVWTGAKDSAGLTTNTNETNKTVTIESAEQLAAFAESVNKGTTYEGYTVSLTNDINLNGQPWTPIGTYEHPFSGTFNGNSRTISNLYINSPSSAYVGLFGRTVSPAKLQYINIKGLIVTGLSQVGALVGSGYTGTIDNCNVSGLITIAGNYQVGGITGYSYATITKCSVSGAEGSKITGTYSGTDLEGDAVGGIVGYFAEGNRTLSGCTVSGVTIAGSRKVGGIAGQAANTLIENCTFNGTVKTNAPEEYRTNKISVGGVVGEKTSSDNTEITKCTVTGTISGCKEDTTHAVLGYRREGTVDESENTTTGATVNYES